MEKIFHCFDLFVRFNLSFRLSNFYIIISVAFCVCVLCIEI